MTEVIAVIIVFCSLTTLIVILAILNRRFKQNNQAEEEIRQSEEKYRQVINLSYDAVMIFDAELGQVLEVNKAAEALYGYSREEFLNLNNMDVTSEPAASALSVRQTIDEKHVYVPLRMHRKKDGTPFPVEISATSFMYGGKKLICGCVRDITGRMKAEADLRASEEKFRDLFNNSGIGMFRSRLDGSVILDVNQKFLDITGRTREEILGKPSVTLWADPKEREEMVRKLVADGRVSEFEHKMIDKRGGVRNCISSLVLYREQGVVEGTILDITERKQGEEALRESEERYRKLVNSINIGIFRTSVDGGRFIQANPALAKIYGYNSVEELLKIQVTDLWQNPGDRKDYIDELRSNGSMRNREVGFLKKDGTPVLCSMTASAQYDENGDFKWINGIVEDITDRKKLQEQLYQSQKMEAIGTLAGGVAHDFNNILMAIIGFGTMAQQRIKADGKTNEFIMEILAGAKRAEELTHSLLAFSRKQTISLKQADLNDIVRSINKMLVRVIGEDIKLTMTLINRELAVMADRGQIEQVLLNLATNARDAMPDGGELTIQTGVFDVDSSYAEAHLFEITGKYAVLTVSDTGMGMDQKTRENIFEPFYTTKEVGKGTGLGLAMVYGIVKQHGGDITVYSEPGKGTTFRAYLPMITSRDEEEQETAGPAPLGRGETILLAEDDHQVRKVTSMCLQESGYKVIEAENGQEALEMFFENRDSIAIVLLDVIMPVKNGRDAYEEMKKLDPDVKAIFMSGYTDDVISRKGILEEGFDFISKPMNPDALMIKINDVLDS